MKCSISRSILWGVFAVAALAAAVDLLWFRGLFTWMITAPLVFVTGVANAAVSLWKRQGKAALLALAVTLVLCGGYAAVLALSLV